MELVHKFMGIGPHGVHHVPHPGEVVGQTGHFGAVAENAHRAGEAAILIQGQPVGEYPDIFEGAHTDIVLRLSGAQDPVQRGAGIDGMEGFAHHPLLIQREHLGCGGIEKDDGLLPVNG